MKKRQVSELRNILFMGMVNKRPVRAIPLITQEKLLKRDFPNSYVKRGQNSLKWIGEIQPSPLSKKYVIFIQLKGKKIEVFVVYPKKLSLHPNKSTLPHVYSTPKQRLCLYYPNRQEWNEGQVIVDSIIPWTSEWLYYYQIWLATGEWLGGGTKHNVEEKIKEK